MGTGSSLIVDNATVSMHSVVDAFVKTCKMYSNVNELLASEKAPEFFRR